MIKGCTKKVIFVRLTESKIFEEASFVVRPGAVGISRESDFLSEAKKIISKSDTIEFTPVGKKRERYGGNIVRDFALFALGGGAVTLISILIRFI